MHHEDGDADDGSRQDAELEHVIVLLGEAVLLAPVPECQQQRVHEIRGPMPVKQPTNINHWGEQSRAHDDIIRKGKKTELSSLV